MRSYNQYCGLAKALDIVGNRWNLLIVRELLIRGACRYTDLKNGLPGIPTNLLVDRLDELAQAGIVSRDMAPPPIATNLFQLTARGRELEPVLEALGRWGAPLLAQPGKKEAFCSHWLALPLKLHLKDHDPDHRPITLELRIGAEPLVVQTVGDGSVTVRPGSALHPDAWVEGTPKLVLGLLMGKLELRQAVATGLKFGGDPEVLQRVRP